MQSRQRLKIAFVAVRSGFALADPIGFGLGSESGRHERALGRPIVVLVGDKLEQRGHNPPVAEKHFKPRQIGPIISTWMTHDNRHLGMIECLIGIQGMRGSADS